MYTAALPGPRRWVLHASKSLTTFFGTLVLVGLTLGGCATQSPPDEVVIRNGVPQTDRSMSAIERVGPQLEAELDAANLKMGAPVFIRIFKEEHQLEVWLLGQDQKHFEKFKTYSIVAWSGRLGPKLKTGDHQSPEGFYAVFPGQMNPESNFELSFNLGFPNAYDKYHDRSGKALMVHGDSISDGCYAMAIPGLLWGKRRNDPIREIWTLMSRAYENGQPYVRVHAFPFRMTDDNMHAHRKHKWIDFWRNLKQGYEAFESDRRPPNTIVKNGRYVFEKE